MGIMMIDGLSHVVKFYNMKVSGRELKLIHEMIIDQVEYINEDLMTYEEYKSKGHYLNDQVHQDMDRLRENMISLQGMEHDIEKILTQVNIDEMQAEMR